MAIKSAKVIATEQLYALAEMVEKLGHNATFEQHAALGSLAAQLELADRLEGIEKSIDLGIVVRNE